MKKSIALFSIFLIIPTIVLSFENSKYTISGISSGGFMANQMSTIYSSQFAGVGTVAGGFYYCAENYLPKIIKADALTIGTADLFLFEPTTQLLSDTLNPIVFFSGTNAGSWFRPSKENPIYQSVSICMGDPEKAHIPTEYLKTNAESKLIDPLSGLSEQKAFIYQGSADPVLKPKMQDKMLKYYKALGVRDENVLSVTGVGSHNFPTDRNDGI
jgi:hypothetical protein